MEKFGYHFIVGLSGTSLSSSEARLLGQLRPSGIIIFKHNIAEDDRDFTQLRALLADAQQASKRDNFLISIDHEGGRVHRFHGGVTHFPPAVEWADTAEDVARTMAKELRAIGFNLSYAPVLDVWREPQNTVIGDRAFSEQPERVVECARRFVEGLHGEGVLSCGKHFPGHGATIADSHFELPVLDDSCEVLEQCDFRPFQEMNDLPLLMTAHVMYPALDPQFPATLSSRILRDLLRETLGFCGCVVSDDLEMDALKDSMPVNQLGAAAIDAGVDLLLLANPKDRRPVERAVAIAEGLNEGHNRETLKGARSRIETLFEFVATL